MLVKQNYASSNTLDLAFLCGGAGSAKVSTISTSLTVAGATFSISVRNWDIIFLCQQLSTKLINSLAGEARQFCGIVWNKRFRVACSKQPREFTRK